MMGGGEAGDCKNEKTLQTKHKSLEIKKKLWGKIVKDLGGKTGFKAHHQKGGGRKIGEVLYVPYWGGGKTFEGAWPKEKTSQ